VHEAAVEEHAAQEVRDLRGHGPVPVLEREEVVGALRAERDVEEQEHRDVDRGERAGILTDRSVG